MYLPRKTPAGLFVFNELDGSSEDISKYVTLGWRFTDQTTDPWTARFNAFKDGHAKAIRAACRVTPGMIEPFGKWLAKHSAVLVAAHGHADKSLNQSGAVAKLAAAIAAQFGLAFEPAALKHKPHESLTRASSAAERERRITKSYEATQISSKYALVVDDFVTQGRTIGEIARAIKQASPRTTVLGFALAKTERRHYASERGNAIDNDHIKPEFAVKWDSEAR